MKVTFIVNIFFSCHLLQLFHLELCDIYSLAFIPLSLHCLQYGYAGNQTSYMHTLQISTVEIKVIRRSVCIFLSSNNFKPLLGT